NVHHLSIGPSRSLHLTAAQPVGDVDPVVEAENGVADAQLWILGGETLVENGALVRLAVSIGVAQESHVGRRSDENPVLPRQNAVGEQEVVGEYSGMFVPAIAVTVFQNLDPSLGRLAGCGAVGVVTHLDDPEAAVLIEGHRHRTLDLRLGRDQFNPQSWS